MDAGTTAQHAASLALLAAPISAAGLATAPEQPPFKRQRLTSAATSTAFPNHVHMPQPMTSPLQGATSAAQSHPPLWHATAQPVSAAASLGRMLLTSAGFAPTHNSKRAAARLPTSSMPQHAQASRAEAPAPPPLRPAHDHEAEPGMGGKAAAEARQTAGGGRRGSYLDLHLSSEEQEWLACTQREPGFPASQAGGPPMCRPT